MRSYATHIIHQQDLRVQDDGVEVRQGLLNVGPQVAHLNARSKDTDTMHGNKGAKGRVIGGGQAEIVGLRPARLTLSSGTGFKLRE